MSEKKYWKIPLGVDGNPSEKYWIFFLGAFGSSEENPIFFLGITITPRGIFQYFFQTKGNTPVRDVTLQKWNWNQCQTYVDPSSADEDGSHNAKF